MYILQRLINLGVILIFAFIFFSYSDSNSYEVNSLENISKELRTVTDKTASILNNSFRDIKGKIVSITRDEIYVYFPYGKIETGEKVNFFRIGDELKKENQTIGNVNSSSGHGDILKIRNRLFITNLSEGSPVKGDLAVIRKPMRKALILPVDSVGIEENKQLKIILPELLTSSIFNSGVFRIVNRQNLSELIKEIEFGRSGFVDSFSAKKMGKLYGADYLIYSSIHQTTDQPLFSTRVIDTESALVVGGANVALPQYVKKGSGKSLNPEPKVDNSNLLFSLNIIVSPSDAKIRILNIKPKFKQGMKLKTGKYHLEISRKGYKKLSKWIKIELQDLILKESLQKISTIHQTTDQPLFSTIRNTQSKHSRHRPDSERHGW